jgi:hypothetical protein
MGGVSTLQDLQTPFCRDESDLSGAIAVWDTDCADSDDSSFPIILSTFSYKRLQSSLVLASLP